MKGSLLLLAVAALAALASTQSQKRVVCYLGTWATYRPEPGKFEVEYIDENICTHIMYSFVGLSSEGKMISLDSYLDFEEDWGKGWMKKTTALMEKNPNLKVLVAIGGWNEGSEKYSQMASSQQSRATFIESAIAMIEKENFVGIDLDWEYPANRGGKPEDKENFVHLCRELREAFDAAGHQDWLVTAAVSAGAETIDTAYDIPGIAQHLDFINIMSYDFNGAWDMFTGHHSPLYGHPNDVYPGFYCEFAVDYWIAGGCPPEKLNMGIPTYGRGWNLADTAVNGPHAPATGPIQAGPYTREAGFWGYNEICEKFQTESWDVRYDQYYRSPYAVNDRQWMGYEDEKSIEEKVALIESRGLGGGMVWSLETDDFHGNCGSEKYPLLKKIWRLLNGEIPIPTTTTPGPTTPTTEGTGPTQTTQTTTTTTQGPTPPPHEICKQPGLNPDPEGDCSFFYECVANGPDWIIEKKDCPPGTLFHPIQLFCDYRDNVIDLCPNNQLRRFFYPKF